MTAIIRFGNDEEFKTSADDTTVALTAASKRHQIVIGTGVLYGLDLGDARTYPLGHEFEIENCSPEIIGVVNSTGTVWERVPPRWAMRFRLVDKSTAAGVWAVFVLPNDQQQNCVRVLFDSHSVSNNITGDPGLLYVPIGTGALRGPDSTAKFGYSGLSYLRTGTTDTGACIEYVYAKLSILAGIGPRVYKHFGGFLALSTGAEEYISRIGWGDKVDGTEHTNAAGFLYDRATHGNFWVIRNINAAGNVTVVTTQVPDLYYAMKCKRIEMDSNCTRTDFWVGKTQVSPAGGLNTYIPANGKLYAINNSIVKTVGITNVALYDDYKAFEYYPTVPRL